MVNVARARSMEFGKGRRSFLVSVNVARERERERGLKRTRGRTCKESTMSPAAEVTRGGRLRCLG